MINIASPFELKSKVFNYEEYKNYLRDLANEAASEGGNSECDFTKLNLHRMARVEKQFNLIPELKDLLMQIREPQLWLVISEGWCGDAAHNVPVIAKVSEEIPMINLRIILRDKNPEVMDQYLTNGTRSIPKLIIFEENTWEELGTWGPRPHNIAQLRANLVQQQPDLPKAEINKHIQLWYSKDRGNSLQLDLARLLKEILY